MKIAEKTHKASVSIREHNWKALSAVPNKSKVINKALDLYFDFEVKKTEFEDNFYAEWLDEALEQVERGETTSMPMKDGKIDFEAFEKEIGM